MMSKKGGSLAAPSCFWLCVVRVARGTCGLRMRSGSAVCEAALHDYLTGGKWIMQRLGGAHSEGGMHVLVIENDNSIRDVIRCILEDAEYTVFHESNVSDGLRVARLNPQIAVVLVDIHLGDRLTGLEILDALRQRLPRAQIILMSGDWAALEKGAPATTAILRKPCGRMELLEQVRSAVDVFKANHGNEPPPTVIRRVPRGASQ
jgi:CheY-like chemotaxis protein